MTRSIVAPWDQSFEGLATRPLGMGTATPAHKKAIAEAVAASIKPSLYLYGYIVNNTGYTLKLTGKALSGDSESWDTDHPVPSTLEPNAAYPYFGVGAWGQAQMTLTYQISTNGGAPEKDA